MDIRETLKGPYVMQHRKFFASQTPNMVGTGIKVMREVSKGPIMFDKNGKKVKHAKRYMNMNPQIYNQEENY